jgi:glycosyltransferase involved in cell wall biosynthesis
MKIVNKKRISFFLISLYGGGGEKVVLDLAKGFVDDGFEVDLLLFSRKGSLESYIDKRINIIDLNVSRIFFSLFPIIKYIRKEKPVAILGTSEHANIVLILAKVFSFTQTKVLVRVGMTFSDLFKNYNKKRDKLIPFLIKMLYPYSDKIIANSQNVARDIKKVSKISQNKIQVIYNSKFISEIIKKSKEGDWFFDKNKKTILAVGRLEIQKDFKTLIEAFDLVQKEINSQLIVLGDGGQREYLEKIVEEKGLLDKVFLADFTQNPYLYMKNSDVLVSTSLWEGFSNVLVEAGILGLPIIATDCGSGTRELLAPNTDLDNQLEKGNIEYVEYGVLVAKQDKENTAKAIINILQNEGISKKYSEKIKQRTSIFEAGNIIKEYKKLF